MSMTMYAVCHSCAHIEPYPARDENDEESAPWICENCRVDDMDIGYDHEQAILRSEIVLHRNER